MQVFSYLLPQVPGLCLDTHQGVPGWATLAAQDALTNPSYIIAFMRHMRSQADSAVRYQPVVLPCACCIQHVNNFFNDGNLLDETGV